MVLPKVRMCEASLRKVHWYGKATLHLLVVGAQGGGYPDPRTEENPMATIPITTQSALSSTR